MGFFKRVHEIVKLIPEGCVMSYGDIAQVMGEPKKAKFVGFAMKFCPGSYPWQRVGYGQPPGNGPTKRGRDFY